MRRVRTTAALASLLLAAAGCSGSHAPASPAATSATPGVHRFRIGALDAFTLLDASGSFPNDGRTFGADEGPARVADVLRAAGLPTDSLALSVNVLAVRAGERLFLVDTGYGPAFGGQLPVRLREAGIAPGDVTDVVLTHRHGDHAGGLVGTDGAAAFPRARVHMAEAEWAAVRADTSLAGLVRAVGSRVVPFAPGTVLAPGVTTVDVRGHTAGHTGVLIESQGERLLAIGDAAHHHVLSLREPEFTVAFDADATVAEAARRALLERAVSERLAVYSPHFPYPGLGTVRREGDGFGWVARP